MASEPVIECSVCGEAIFDRSYRIPPDRLDLYMSVFGIAFDALSYADPATCWGCLITGSDLRRLVSSIGWLRTRTGPFQYGKIP